MQRLKKQFAESLVANICRLSKLLFNIHSDENLLGVFGLDKAALELTLQQVVETFPDDYFESLTANQLREMESILAREFIFFQVQEKESAKHYQAHLQHFSHIFLRDMKKRFKVNSSSTKMKEE